MKKRVLPIAVIVFTIIIAIAISQKGEQIWRMSAYFITRAMSSFGQSEIKLIENPTTPAEKIVNGAKMEAINKVSYDASYQQIPYPDGDVASDRGACTDVVVRALRTAGYDLQKLIHEDMKQNFNAYPQKWGLTAPDPNIDHRRVPNQIAFFKRHGKELPTATTGEDLKTWQPGDIVYWNLHGSPDHTGVISNDKSKNDLPLVIHNCGKTRQEPCLNAWKIVGHYRYPTQ